VDETIFRTSKPDGLTGIQNQATEVIMAHAMFGSIFTMKMLIRVAFTAISLSSVAAANSAMPYHAPTYNYYQNNWMTGD
jgi:hypothetical protein